MTSSYVSDKELEQWDQTLITNPDGGNVFQTVEMAETKRRNGWTPRYLILDGIAVTVLEKRVTLLGMYWYLPKGPGVTNPTALVALIPKLRAEARRNGVFVVKIESEVIESPEAHQALRSAGLVSTPAVQPNSSTVIIDLAPPLNDIMTGLNQKGRHAIRRAERDGVTVEVVEFSEEHARTMYDLLRATSEGRFETSIRDFAYYRAFWQSFVESGMGSLFFARYEGEIVAAAFSMYLGSKGLYKDGASVRAKTAYGASHLLQWEIITWLKDRGVTSYDLCGAPHSSQINDESHKLYGVGRFKTSFNKHVTDYIGCYDLPIRPLAYQIWQRIGQRVAVSIAYRLRGDQWF